MRTIIPYAISNTSYESIKKEVRSTTERYRSDLIDLYEKRIEGKLNDTKFKKEIKDLTKDMKNLYQNIREKAEEAGSVKEYLN